MKGWKNITCLTVLMVWHSKTTRTNRCVCCGDRYVSTLNRVVRSEISVDLHWERLCICVRGVRGEKVNYNGGGWRGREELLKTNLFWSISIFLCNVSLAYVTHSCLTSFLYYYYSIINNYSLKSWWIVVEHLPMCEAWRWIFFMLSSELLH